MRRQDNISRHARRLLRFLTRNRKKISPLLILTHDFPDPDALAGALALSHLVSAGFGIEARIAYGGIIGRMENRAMVNLLRMPVHKLRPTDLKRYKQIALVDTQPAFQNNSFPKDRQATIVVDQHSSETPPRGRLVLVDPECGATCSILARALLLKKIEIPARVATALTYGILSDTLNFYRAHRPDVIQVYLDILPFCDMRALARIQNPPRSKDFFLVLGSAIQRAVTRRRLIVCHLGFVKNPDLVSQIADFLLNYREVQWAFCTGRYKGKLHLSLRSGRPETDAGEVLRSILANRADAGGHGTIAGGSFPVGKSVAEPVWTEVESSLVHKLMRRLRIPTRGDFHVPFPPPLPERKGARS